MGKITTTQEYSLVPLEKDSAYPIPVSDWKFLKGKIEAIDTGKLFFQTIGSAILGVAASAFVAAITIPAVQDDGKTIMRCWDSVGASVLLGLLCLWFAGEERKHVAGSKGAALEEMNRQEGRFTKTP